MRNLDKAGVIRLVFMVAAGLSLIEPSETVAAQYRADSSRPACTSQTGVSPSRLATLARGFNLTGWLDSASPRAPAERALAALRQRGFTHIRLPVTPEKISTAFSSPDQATAQLKMLDHAIDRLIALGFGVSLDVHPGDKLGRLHVAEPDRALEFLKDLWHVLARRYADRPAERLYFEVLNEPTVSETIWDTQGPRLVDEIRRAAPGRTIIYGAANYQQISALSALTPLADSNIVYAVHFYAPMVFTHQGLDWSDDPLRYLQGVPFPARSTDPSVRRLLNDLALLGRDQSAELLRSQLREPWTEERVANEIGKAGTWALRYQRPVILNEFGVLRWKAAPADRYRWLRAVRRAAEGQCIAWTHWDYAEGFGFMERIGDREVPDQGTLDALIERGPPAH
jgi:endoglucanase